MKKRIAGTRRKRDRDLASQVGERLKFIMGKRTCGVFARVIGVRPQTMWCYIIGKAMPSMEVLLIISEKEKVSVDWILKGMESPKDKDIIRQKRIEMLNRIERYGVAEEVEQYADWLIAKKQQALPGLGVPPEKEPLPDLRTMAERLAYFRAHVVRLPMAEFCDRLGIMPTEMAAIETGAAMPDSRLLTRMNAKFRGRLNLDWLLGSQ